MLVRLCDVIAVSYLQRCNQRCGYSCHGYSIVKAVTSVEQLVYAYTRMHICAAVAATAAKFAGVCCLLRLQLVGVVILRLARSVRCCTAGLLPAVSGARLPAVSGAGRASLALHMSVASPFIECNRTDGRLYRQPIIALHLKGALQRKSLQLRHMSRGSRGGMGDLIST
jgi:hypothetical protein